MKKDPVTVRYHRQCDRLCRQFAERLGAPLVNEANVGEFQIEVDADCRGLVLHCNALPNASLRIDFARVRANAGADPLLKAIGSRARTVVDATAGWATDAVHLARRGMDVTAVERNPIAAALLAHAHATCRDPELKARLTIIHDDSIAYLRALTTQPDVVYLDPMYPPQSKSAATKKPMALLRMLAGAADHSVPLFEQAMCRALLRVVVKRPRRAPPIQPGRVGETVGKLVRFDIYQPRVSHVS